MITVLLGGVLAVVGFFFFNDTKDMKTAVNMDSGRPPVGAEVAEEASVAPSAIPSVPAAPAPSPQPSLTSPTPQGTPAETIRDERPAAVDLVKNYPLDGDRGTVGQWLQYSFAANPGSASTERWNAGAVEESTYLVQYEVQPPGRESINYLFEADVSRKTVKGKNPAARELLAGGGAVAKTAVSKAPAKSVRRVRQARPAKKRRKPVVRRSAPSRPKARPLPPPSGSDMTPPSQDDAVFRSDTVLPNL
ncbi:MAG TPA: hypothetical protein DEB40_11335 [Elusimicrobia bacterium]|nr:hypothetical protein [Elusimicrobiota bacterium]HBT62325.1 hypothetical protein [Elusimicrobiota bacterium]